MNINLSHGLLGCMLVGFTQAATAAVPQQPPQLQLGYYQVSDASLEQVPGSGEFTIKETHLSGKLGKKETPLGTLLIGANYQQHRFELASNYTSRTLHQLALPVTLVNKSDQWTIVSQVAPSLNTDFEELDKDDYTTTALLRAAYHHSDTTTWVAGAAFDRSFGDSQLYPVLGVNYTPNNNWLLQLTLPRMVVKYMPRPRTIIYWQAQPNGNKWNVDVPAINRSINITTKAIRSGIGIEFNITQQWWIKAEAGREFNRNLETINDGGVEFDLDVEDAYYLGASIFFRI